MKRTLFTIISILLFVSTVYLPLSYAQDYTKWGLPEGATARLGKGWISDVTYSPDGKLLAVASPIGIWLYDVHSGQELKLITGHTGRVYSVVFSPDGQTLASGSADQRVRFETRAIVR